MPMLIVYTQIYIIKHGLLSIIDFKGMGIPYTLGSSDSSTLEPMIICYCVENQIYLSGTI